MKINETQLKNLLLKAFEAGFYGSLDLKENVIEELVDEAQSLIDISVVPSFSGSHPLVGTWTGGGGGGSTANSGSDGSGNFGNENIRVTVGNFVVGSNQAEVPVSVGEGVAGNSQDTGFQQQYLQQPPNPADRRTWNFEQTSQDQFRQDQFRQDQFRQEQIRQEQIQFNRNNDSFTLSYPVYISSNQINHTVNQQGSDSDVEM